MIHQLIKKINSITKKLLKILNKPISFITKNFENKKNMVYIIFILLVLVLGTYFDLSNATADRMVHQTKLYEEAEHIKYEEAFVQGDACYFVYYYVENTRFTQTALNSVTTFY